MRKLAFGLLATFLSVVMLTACGAGATGTTASDAAASTSLAVGATPVPHAEILRFVKDNLAAREGLQLEIVEFNDYVQPNLALNDKQIDANFFQHVPYMTDFGAEKGIEMTAIADVHIEPLGLYSSKLTSIDAIEPGSVIAIPNDATNAGRALQLLANEGLLTLKEGVGTAATVGDIVENPRQLRVEELEAAQLPRALPDTAAAVINTNYALEAGLKPEQDALALEAGQDNPYANVLTVLKGRENDPTIQKLARLLQSPEVKQFIQERYEGAVIPAF